MNCEEDVKRHDNNFRLGMRVGVHCNMDKYEGIIPGRQMKSLNIVE